MNRSPANPATGELTFRAVNGWPMLIVNLTLLVGAMVSVVSILVSAARTADPQNLWWPIVAIPLVPLAIVMLFGHFTLQPNEARVLILFGAYRGTVRTSGFWWANPFYSRIRSRIAVHPTAANAQKTTHGNSVTGIGYIVRST